MLNRKCKLIYMMSGIIVKLKQQKMSKSNSNKLLHSCLDMPDTSKEWIFTILIWFLQQSNEINNIAPILQSGKQPQFK